MRRWRLCCWPRCLLELKVPKWMLLLMLVFIAAAGAQWCSLYSAGYLFEPFSSNIFAL